jgi:hypothetical protein
MTRGQWHHPPLDRRNVRTGATSAEPCASGDSCISIDHPQPGTEG